MKQQIKFIDENFNRFTEELKELLRIPSVSTDPVYKNDIQKCAEWLKDHMDKIGLSRTEIIQTAKHPIVYSEYVSNSSLLKNNG